MLPGTLKHPLLVLALLGLAGVVFLGGCGGGGTKKPAVTATARATAVRTVSKIDISNVPELQDGKITVGSDIAYAPIEYFEEGTQNATGMDVDLLAALAGALGVQFEFQQVADFAGIVGDLKVKRYDVVMSAISVTPARQAEIDFVSYFGPVGTGILVPAGNPKGLTGPSDLCGLKVAAQVGTIQVDQLNALNEGTCKDKHVTITTFPDNPTAVQELSLGRIDAELADDPVAQYSALKSNGNLTVAITRFPDSQPYGIGVRKDATALKAVLQQALQRIIDDGTYLTILRKWGQETFAIQ